MNFFEIISRLRYQLTITLVFMLCVSFIPAYSQYNNAKRDLQLAVGQFQNEYAQIAQQQQQVQLWQQTSINSRKLQQQMEQVASVAPPVIEEEQTEEDAQGRYKAMSEGDQLSTNGESLYSQTNDAQIVKFLESSTQYPYTQSEQQQQIQTTKSHGHVNTTSQTISQPSQSYLQVGIDNSSTPVPEKEDEEDDESKNEVGQTVSGIQKQIIRRAPRRSSEQQALDEFDINNYIQLLSSISLDVDQQGAPSTELQITDEDSNNIQYSQLYSPDFAVFQSLLNQTEYDESAEVTESADSFAQLQSFMASLIDSGQLSSDTEIPGKSPELVMTAPTVIIDTEALQPQTIDPTQPDSNTLDNEQSILLQPAPEPEPEEEIIPIPQPELEGIYSPEPETPQPEVETANLSPTSKTDDSIRVASSQQDEDDSNSPPEAVSLDNIPSWAPAQLPLPLPLTLQLDQPSPIPSLTVEARTLTPQTLQLTPDDYAESSSTESSTMDSEPIDEDYSDLFSFSISGQNVLQTVSPEQISPALSVSILPETSSGGLSISELQLQQFLQGTLENQYEDGDEDGEIKEKQLQLQSTPTIEVEIPVIQASISSISDEQLLVSPAPDQEVRPQQQILDQEPTPEEEGQEEVEDSSNLLSLSLQPLPESEAVQNLGPVTHTLLPNPEFQQEAVPLMSGSLDVNQTLWQKVKMKNTNQSEFRAQISSFISMLENNGLSKEICGLGNEVTIFAPINEVLDDILQNYLVLQNNVTAFIENIGIVRDILRYHIIDNPIETLEESQPLPTLLENQTIMIEHNDYFGQIILRPPDSTTSFVFVRIQEGYSTLFSCKAKTVIVDAVIYPQ